MALTNSSITTAPPDGLTHLLLSCVYFMRYFGGPQIKKIVLFVHVLIIIIIIIIITQITYFGYLKYQLEIAPGY